MHAAKLAAELGGVAHKRNVAGEMEWVEKIAFAKAEAGGLDILENSAGVLDSGGATIRDAF